MIGVTPLIFVTLANILICGSPGPVTTAEGEEAVGEPKSALGFLSLVKIPTALLYGLCVFVAGCNFTFITALLQPDLASVSQHKKLTFCIFIFFGSANTC